MIYEKAQIYWRIWLCSDCLKIFSYSTCRGGSRTAATSQMEYLVIIVNGFQPLTIITNHSILDVAAALDPPLTFAIPKTCATYILVRRRFGLFWFSCKLFYNIFFGTFDRMRSSIWRSLKQMNIYNIIIFGIHIRYISYKTDIQLVCTQKNTSGKVFLTYILEYIYSGNRLWDSTAACTLWHFWSNL